MTFEKIGECIQASQRASQFSQRLTSVALQRRSLIKSLIRSAKRLPGGIKRRARRGYKLGIKSLKQRI